MLHFLWGALVSVAVVANEGTTPCGRLEAPLYRSDGIDRHAQVLADCEACLDALEFATDYYDAIPLVSTRLFQLQAYAWARNDLATHAQKFATLARRRATLAEKIDASAARPAETRAILDEALSNYGECKRSGRGRGSICRSHNHTGRRPSRDTAPYEGAVSEAPNAAATLLVHLHLTFHGGTNLLKLIGDYSCAMVPRSCARSIHHIVRGPMMSTQPSLIQRRRRCGLVSHTLSNN